jgi:hypothetical protein
MELLSKYTHGIAIPLWDPRMVVSTSFAFVVLKVPSTTKYLLPLRIPKYNNKKKKIKTELNKIK